jgi:putative spermidine/putrescine transport system permease protein
VRRAAVAFSGAVFAFLLLPILVVIPASFNDSKLLNFPPEYYSTRWYDELASDPVWLESLERTLVAGLVATLVATPVGTMAAISLVRGRYPGKSLVRLLIISPLLVPLVVLAVGLYGLFSDFRAVGSPSSLGLAHATLALPFVVLVMTGAVQNFDERLESAARTLGANRWQAFWMITFPALRPAIGVAALLAFITSFDEVVLAIFLSTGGETLPVEIFNYLNSEISPVIAAISTVLIGVVSCGFIAGIAFAARSRRRTARFAARA